MAILLEQAKHALKLSMNITNHNDRSAESEHRRSQQQSFPVGLSGVKTGLGERDRQQQHFCYLAALQSPLKTGAGNRKESPGFLLSSLLKYSARHFSSLSAGRPKSDSSMVRRSTDWNCRAGGQHLSANQQSQAHTCGHVTQKPLWSVTLHWIADSDLQTMRGSSMKPA